MREIRPWGYFEILYEDSNTKVKKIRVESGQVLSYQSHEKRREDWIIIDGSGYVVLDDLKSSCVQGDRFRIEALQKHRIGSSFDDPGLTFIEIQTGEYFGEDDIIRYSDIYNRS
jgi:mannose-6-phosphate isomerase-like protein (cupin superfamily)